MIQQESFCLKLESSQMKQSRCKQKPQEQIFHVHKRQKLSLKTDIDGGLYDVLCIMESQKAVNGVIK